MAGASLVGQIVNNLSALWETGVRSWGWEDPWRKEWQPIPGFLPGEFHGQRSLASYSPWGRKESDTTEWLTHTYRIRQREIMLLICIQSMQISSIRTGTTSSFPGLSLFLLQCIQIQPSSLLFAHKIHSLFLPG